MFLSIIEPCDDYDLSLNYNNVTQAVCEYLGRNVTSTLRVIDRQTTIYSLIYDRIHRMAENSYISNNMSEKNTENLKYIGRCTGTFTAPA